VPLITHVLDAAPQGDDWSRGVCSPQSAGAPGEFPDVLIEEKGAWNLRAFQENNDEARRARTMHLGVYARFPDTLTLAPTDAVHHQQSEKRTSTCCS
jgi:hypothetical protein